MLNKKIFLSTILLAFFLMACSLLNQFHPPGDATQTASPSPFPSSTSERKICIVIADRLNLRIGPGTSWGSAAILKNGETVTILSELAQGNWIHVNAAGREGWINQLYCKGK